MQCDDLVAQDILSRRDISWDLNGPGVVIRDEGVSCPVTWVAAGEEPNAIYFEPAQCGLIDRLTGPVARGEVVDDWSVVGDGPGGPFES